MTTWKKKLDKWEKENLITHDTGYKITEFENLSELDRNLNKWEKENLITPEEKQNIKKYEKERKKSSFINSLIILALAAITLGIISIVAANWDKITIYVRLFNSFLLFGFLTFYTIRIFIKEDSKKKEVCLFGIFVATLVTYALIVQTFHITTIPFWICSITAPLMFVSKKRLIPTIWTIFFACTVIVRTEIVDYLITVFDKNEILLFYIISLLSLILFLVFNYIDRKIKGEFKIFKIWENISEVIFYLAAIYSICFSYFVIPEYTYVKLLGILLAYASFISAAYYYHKNKMADKVKLNIDSICFCIILSYFCTIYDLFDNGICLLLSGIFMLIVIIAVKQFSKRLRIKKEQNNE